jgi:hypothetical protein
MRTINSSARLAARDALLVVDSLRMVGMRLKW